MTGLLRSVTVFIIPGATQTSMLTSMEAVAVNGSRLEVILLTESALFRSSGRRAPLE